MGVRSVFGLPVVALVSLLEQTIPECDIQCFISFPDVDDNALSVFTALARDTSDRTRKLIWLVRDVRAARERLERRLGPDVAAATDVVPKNSLLGLWCFLRARRVFFTHGHYWFVRAARESTKLVNLWHGMPLKAIGLLDDDRHSEVHATDITIASSAFFRRVMSRSFGVGEDRVLVTGLPRCDQLANPSAGAWKLRRRLVASAERLIVWMPTYCVSTTGEVRADSAYGPQHLAEKFLQSLTELSAMAAKNQCVVVVKLHPMDFLNSLEIVAPDNVVVMKHDDPLLLDAGLYDLLSVSDGLITDASSVLFDFMATRRPILITDGFFKQYKRGLTFDINTLLDAVFCSENLTDCDSFFEAVRNARMLEGSGMAAFCEFSDGRSTERLIAQLDRLDALGHGAALPS